METLFDHQVVILGQSHVVAIMQMKAFRHGQGRAGLEGQESISVMKMETLFHHQIVVMDKNRSVGIMQVETFFHREKDRD